MPKLSARQAKKALQWCIEIYGHRCYICGKKRVKLELEHRNGDSSFNPMDGSNWGAVCPKCNRLKRSGNNVGPLYPVCVSVCEDVEENFNGNERFYGEVSSSSAELVKNEEYEGRFRRYVYDVVRSKGFESMKELWNSGAEISGCSPESGKRYLNKLCSLVGDFEYFDGPGGARCVRLKVPPSPPKEQKPAIPAPEQEKSSALPQNGEGKRFQEAAKKGL